jgi:hypothetical protein
MTMSRNRLKELLEQRGKIEDHGGETSPDFKQWAAAMKKDIAKIIPVRSFMTGHYYVSAVLEPAPGVYWYLCIDDVRHHWAEDAVYYRTMKRDTDWTGGYNRWCRPDELSEILKRIAEGDIK